MYIRSSALVSVAALVAVAAAAPSALEARDGCNTGPIQCCTSTQTSTPTTLNSLSSLLGIALPDISGLIGLNCSPLTAVGLGTGATCTNQAVCCTNNSFNGLINLGCSPINLSL